MTKRKTVPLFAWCIVGAIMGTLGAWLQLQSGDGTNGLQTVRENRGLQPIGVTAALQMPNALLLDARRLTPDDLPVAGAVRAASRINEASSANRTVIVIGDERDADFLRHARGASYFVPSWTLRRTTHLPPQWEITTAQLQQKMRRGAVRTLDVREEHEFRASHIKGSERESMFEVEARLANEKRPVALFCLTGHRSAFLVQRLRARGYTNVLSVRGGWLDWKAQHRPLNERSAKSNRQKNF